jgi:hypothetical protein
MLTILCALTSSKTENKPWSFGVVIEVYFFFRNYCYPYVVGEATFFTSFLSWKVNLNTLSAAFIFMWFSYANTSMPSHS